MRLDYNDALFAVPQEQLDAHAQLAVAAYQEIIQKSGRGNDFLGWLSLPEDVTEQDIQDIEECAAKLAAQSKVVVVIGIGGSYLGARAVIEALQHCFKPMMRSDTPTVLYAGNNMSEDYIHDLLNVLDENDYSLVVISKSGTTTEPALAFRILKQHCEEKYGVDAARDRIVAITDRARCTFWDSISRKAPASCLRRS